MTQEPRDPNAPAAADTGAAPPPEAPPPQQQTASQPPPAQQSWQSQPQQPGSPPPAGGAPPGSSTPAWMGNLTDQTPVPGPAGYFYADVPNRSIAMIIDVIGVLVVYFIVGVIAVAIFGTQTVIGSVANPAAMLVQSILSYAIWAAYFIYTWVNMRGTLGMKALGLQIGHETDGRTLTYEQAAYRFGVLFGPIIVIGLLTALIPALGALGLLSFVWFIYVLVTMAQSPNKQGIHDRYGKSVVVKAGRSVG
ncbi:RDD family protein [soil metagenome]